MHLPTWERARPGRGLDKPYYRVHGPTMHGPLVCLILGELPYKGMAHYDMQAKRHYPCPGEEHCTYCHNNRGKRRKGYIAAEHTGSKVKFVLELTDSAMNQLQEVIEQRGTLRGLRVKLERKPNKEGKRTPTGRVILTVLADQSGENISEAFDEMPHVFKMWGLSDGEDGLGNAVPANPRTPTPEMESSLGD